MLHPRTTIARCRHPLPRSWRSSPRRRACPCQPSYRKRIRELFGRAAAKRALGRASDGERRRVPVTHVCRGCSRMSQVQRAGEVDRAREETRKHPSLLDPPRRADRRPPCAANRGPALVDPATWGTEVPSPRCAHACYGGADAGHPPRRADGRRLRGPGDRRPAIQGAGQPRGAAAPRPRARPSRRKPVPRRAPRPHLHRQVCPPIQVRSGLSDRHHPRRRERPARATAGAHRGERPRPRDPAPGLVLHAPRTVPSGSRAAST